MNYLQFKEIYKEPFLITIPACCGLYIAAAHNEFLEWLLNGVITFVGCFVATKILSFYFKDKIVNEEYEFYHVGLIKSLIFISFFFNFFIIFFICKTIFLGNYLVI